MYLVWCHKHFPLLFNKNKARFDDLMYSCSCDLTILRPAQKYWLFLFAIFTPKKAVKLYTITIIWSFFHRDVSITVFTYDTCSDLRKLKACFLLTWLSNFKKTYIILDHFPILPFISPESRDSGRRSSLCAWLSILGQNSHWDHSHPGKRGCHGCCHATCAEPSRAGHAAGKGRCSKPPSPQHCVQPGKRCCGGLQ